MMDLLVTHDVRLSVGKHCLHVNTAHNISLNVQLGFFSLTVTRHCSETHATSYASSNAATQKTWSPEKSHNRLADQQTL